LKASSRGLSRTLSRPVPAGLNLVERWFGELNRQKPCDAASFASVADLRSAIAGFLEVWNDKPKAFRLDRKPSNPSRPSSHDAARLWSRSSPGCYRAAASERRKLNHQLFSRVRRMTTEQRVRRKRCAVRDWIADNNCRVETPSLKLFPSRIVSRFASVVCGRQTERAIPNALLRLPGEGLCGRSWRTSNSFVLQVFRFAKHSAALAFARHRVITNGGKPMTYCCNADLKTVVGTTTNLRVP